jgi:hypothetical protein
MSMPRGDVRTSPSAAPAAQPVIQIEERMTSPRDRIRWGPVWAGLAVALSTYLLLQLTLVAVGLVDLSGDATADAIWSAAAAIVAFFLGGLTAGATAMWRGVDDGVIHGVVLWGVGLLALVTLSVVGSGLALGSVDTTSAFDQFSGDQVDTAQASDDAQEASGRALAGLVLALGAAVAGGAAGTKMWPRDRRSIDLRDDRAQRAG